MTKILIIDGQGGKIGKTLIETIKTVATNCEITAVGTNSMATQNMMKAGPDKVATGENAVLCACRKADIITGPIGIVVADALLGEISPTMAKATGQSQAIKILLPINKCDTVIIGVQDMNMSTLIDEAAKRISHICTTKTDKPILL